MQDDLEYRRAETAALRLIARAEQNIAGLTRKLEKRKVAADVASAVILHLCKLDLLNDSRYARLWLQSRLRRFGQSPRRLLSSLCARGIQLDDARSALKEVLDNDAELAMLEKFAEKYAQKNGLKFILKNEGFSTAVINRFLEID